MTPEEEKQKLPLGLATKLHQQIDFGILEEWVHHRRQWLFRKLEIPQSEESTNQLRGQLEMTRDLLKLRAESERITKEI